MKGRRGESGLIFTTTTTAEAHRVRARPRAEWARVVGIAPKHHIIDLVPPGTLAGPLGTRCSLQKPFAGISTNSPPARIFFLAHLSCWQCSVDHRCNLYSHRPSPLFAIIMSSDFKECALYMNITDRRHLRASPSTNRSASGTSRCDACTSFSRWTITCSLERWTRRTAGLQGEVARHKHPTLPPSHHPSRATQLSSDRNTTASCSKALPHKAIRQSRLLSLCLYLLSYLLCLYFLASLPPPLPPYLHPLQLRKHSQSLYLNHHYNTITTLCPEKASFSLLPPPTHQSLTSHPPSLPLNPLYTTQHVHANATQSLHGPGQR